MYAPEIKAHGQNNADRGYQLSLNNPRDAPNFHTHAIVFSYKEETEDRGARAAEFLRCETLRNALTDRIRQMRRSFVDPILSGLLRMTGGGAARKSAIF
jgi:hypothetical protein